MLVNFSVSNYKSLKDTVTLSMVAEKQRDNTFSPFKEPLNTSAVLYGANASGKSAVIEAFNFMKNIVLNKKRILLSTDELPVNPFKLSSETEDDVTSFDVVFDLDVGNEIHRYKYGFEYDKNCVYAEYLYIDVKQHTACVFDFDVDYEKQKYGSKPEYSRLRSLKKPNKNMLFLWTADQNGFDFAHNVLQWFKNINIIQGNHLNNKPHLLTEYVGSKDKKELILKLLRDADLGIEDINIENDTFITTHYLYDKEKNYIGNVPFDMGNEESLGTRSFFSMSAHILNALEYGSILFVDELDLSLHPLLAREICMMFNNPQINKKGAQLVFTTQDTNLLRKNLFTKDQIWFVEKNSFGESSLASLLDYKYTDTRGDLESSYLKGKFGAIPYLGHFDFYETEDDE